MSTAMEHNSVIPLYAQIVEYLRKDIAANVFGRNGRIPTEAELSEKYGVSRITVRRAVDELVSQGLVEKKQGKGTFVTAPRFSRRLDSGPLSFSEMCEANGLVPGAKILETGIVVPKSPSVRQQLMKRAIIPWNTPIFFRSIWSICPPIAISGRCGGSN